MSALELKIYELLKARFNEDEAQKVIEYIEMKTEEKVNQKKDVFLTKDDKVDIIGSMYKAVFTANILQFLATIGSMIAIFHFMLSK